MDKKTEEAKKLNAKSRQNNSMESERSYTNMSNSNLQQAMNSTNSASNSVSSFSNPSPTGYPKPDEKKTTNEKSRLNRGK